MRCLAALLLLAVAAGAGAQQQDPPNSLLLVAKPNLVDPNFRRSVVLVTQATDAHTVGVILNRPMREKLTELHPQLSRAPNYYDPVYSGGPVMRQVLVGVFEVPTALEPPAYRVLPTVYMTLHPAGIELLLTGVASRYRLYSGFSGWAPGQLQRELEQNSWFVLPASADIVFRKDTGTLWQELIDRTLKTEGPAEAGPVARTSRAAEVPRERHVFRGLRHASETRVTPCPSSTALLVLALPGQVARNRAVSAPGEPGRDCTLLRAK